MSSADILFYVAISAFILAVGCVILSILMFFRLNIRGVYNDLTGKTVAREVQTMRKERPLTQLRPKPDKDVTTLLQPRPDADATTLLQSDADATTLLRESVPFTLCSSIVVIHTDEVIT